MSPSIMKSSEWIHDGRMIWHGVFARTDCPLLVRFQQNQLVTLTLPYGLLASESGYIGSRGFAGR
jgi:hypothetical protein